MTSSSLQPKLKASSQKQTEISSWINHNGYSKRGNQIWKIGLSNADNILKIQGQVLMDMECIHWKYWKFDSFQEAFHIMKALNKSAFVMKSDLSEYLGKGSYIFLYKTHVPKDHFLGHLINFPVQLHLSR